MSKSKNERIEITMQLFGAKQVAAEGEVASKGIRGVGKAGEYTGIMSMRAASKTSLLTRAYSNLKTAAKYAFGAIIIGGAFALKSAITKTAELGKATWELNRNLGLSTKAASRWAAVGMARGIQGKAMGTAFGILSSKMVDAARKGGPALEHFRQIGMGLHDVKKGANNANWGIQRVAKALGEAHGGMKRMAAMKTLLGKGWATMGPLFAHPKELQEQLHWADKYHTVLDTKTTKAIHGMGLAFAQSKQAMLGLQLHLAKSLMPTIIGANRDFQKFVLTLNSNKLSSSQKIARISQQFLGLENTLIKIITAAIPKVAEQGGVLGLKLAGAVVKGFLNAGIWGKLVITAWLVKFMGGGALIGSVAGRVGRAIAVGIATRLFPALEIMFAVTGSLGRMIKGSFARLGFSAGAAFRIGVTLGIAALSFWIGKEIGERLPKSWGQWGINAGQNFVNALSSVVNPALEVLGLNTIGKVNWHEHVIRPSSGHFPHGFHLNPHPYHIPKSAGNQIVSPPKGQLPRHKLPRHKLPRHKLASLAPSVQHVHLHVDGREIAFGVLRQGENAAALA